MPHATDTVAEQREEKLHQMYKLAKAGETNDLIHWCTVNFSILFEKLRIGVPISHTMNTVLADPRRSLFIDISRENISVTYFFGGLNLDLQGYDYTILFIDRARFFLIHTRPY